MSRVLLVAGGEPSDWPTIEPATYDYFVGIDRGCLHLLEADLPLQLAVGDFDSLSREEYHFVQETAETLIQAPAEKDDTDTQLALQNGMTFTEEFDGVNDFLALQQSDYNAIADEIEVVEVKIADEVLDFKGNMGQLYYELMK